MTHTPARLVLACAGILLLQGCFESGADATHSSYSGNGSGSATGDQKHPPGIEDQVRSAVRVAFDPENQVIPFPNNLLFEAGASTTEELDGTLNVPIDDPEASSAGVALALNELDGFSTTESWRVAFTGAIDPATLEVGRTVRVFALSTDSERYPARIRPQQVSHELSADDIQLDYQSDSHVLMLRPRRPLAYNTTYSIIITHGVTDPQGLWVDGPLTSVVAKGQTALELDENNQPTVCDDLDKSDVALLQCTTHFAIDPVLRDERFGLNREQIMLAWAVTTQRADSTFTRLADAISNRELNPSVPGGTKCDQPVCLLDVGSLSGKTAPESPGGKTLIWPGSIRLPVLNHAPSAATSLSNNNYGFGRSTSTDSGVLSAQWQCSGTSCNSDNAMLGTADLSSQPLLPAIRNWVTHPLVLAAPNPSRAGVPAKPAGGYPLVIFQHAIQQDRTNALALADALAQKGFAVIAIDMPLHGLVKGDLPAGDSRLALYAGDLNDQLYNSTLAAARNIIPLMVERTFYLDLVDTEGNVASDGVIDSSGAHFLNPSAPLTQRDTLRQAGIDLVTLVRYLRNGEFRQCGMDGLLKSCNASKFDFNLSNHINFSQLHFVGHSVGNLVAAPFLAYDQNIRTVSMLAPTGGIMRSLEGSAVIGPRLAEGLAAKDVLPGSENYYRFFASVQAAIDSVEPLNHAAAIATRQNGEESEPRPVYMAQLLGDDDNPADQVLPVALTRYPLAGSSPLAQAMGLQRSAELAQQGDNAGLDIITLEGPLQDSGDPGALQVAMGFRRGDHASFLLPATDIEDLSLNGDDPHAEMQRQVANFLSHQGVRVDSINRTNWLR